MGYRVSAMGSSLLAETCAVPTVLLGQLLGVHPQVAVVRRNGLLRSRDEVLVLALTAHLRGEPSLSCILIRATCASQQLCWCRQGHAKRSCVHKHACFANMLPRCRALCTCRTMETVCEQGRPPQLGRALYVSTHDGLLACCHSKHDPAQ
jgi:hypothetical protein